MIFLDYNQLFISIVTAQILDKEKNILDEGFMRHCVLNTIQSYNRKFKEQYGKIIIAADNKSWRKAEFPYYKSRRHLDRLQSTFDWASLFENLNKIQNELKEYFPYIVISVDGAEGDDVIGTIVHERLGRDLAAQKDTLIVASDKDYLQLQTYANVDQWCPLNKKKLTVKNPTLYLKEHIIIGDKGDGIPNILSDSDSFVQKKKQKSIYKDKLAQWLKDDSEIRETENYKRNQKLIDLSMTPKWVKDNILLEFDLQQNKGKKKLLDYFIKYRLKSLMDKIGDF